MEKEHYLLSKSVIRRFITSNQAEYGLPVLRISDLNLDILFAEMTKFLSPYIENHVELRKINEIAEKQMMELKEHIPFKKQGANRGKIKKKSISLETIAHFPFRDFTISNFIQELQTL